MSSYIHDYIQDVSVPGGGERVPDTFWFRAGDGMELLAGKWRHGNLLGRWRRAPDGAGQAISGIVARNAR
jgi:hypothetical protein